MKRKQISVLLCAVLVLTLFSACAKGNNINSGPAEQDFPVTIGEVTVKSKPEKVAVLSPNLADVVLAMGYEIQLAAKSEDCTQEALSVLPNVSLDDAEGIKAAGATLALLDQPPTDDQKATLSNAGITVLVCARAADRSDLNRLYQEVGSALRGAKTGYNKGDRIAGQLMMSIDDIGRMIPKKDTITTMCYLLDTNGGTVTGDTFEGKLLETAGLYNAASDGENNQMDVESLLHVTPQYIFCPTGMKDQLANAEGYKDLPAVKEGKVYEMDPHWFAQQGDGMVQAVSYMAGVIYPELAEEPESSATSEPSSQPSGSENGIPQKDERSDNVMKMQKRLDELGYMFVKCTGYYGNATVTAIKGFQMYNGMSTTGVADQKMLDILYSEGAKANPKA